MTDKLFIYVLRESGDKVVRYVGQTKNPQIRLSQHKQVADSQSKNATRRWIGGVLDRDGEIEIEVIEECECYDATERERYWLLYYRKKGHPLTNTVPPRPGMGWEREAALHKAAMR